MNFTFEPVYKFNGTKCGKCNKFLGNAIINFIIEQDIEINEEYPPIRICVECWNNLKQTKITFTNSKGSDPTNTEQYIITLNNKRKFHWHSTQTDVQIELDQLAIQIYEDHEVSIMKCGGFYCKPSGG